MAKSKQSPALYELIAKQGARGKSPFDRPLPPNATAKPMQEPDAEPEYEPAPAPEPEPEVVAVPEPVAVEPPPVVVEAAPAPAPAPAHPEPRPQASEGSVRAGRFWRDPVNVAALATLLAVIAIAAGFARSRGWWGSTATASGPGSIAEVMQGPAHPEVMKILGVVPEGQRRTAPADSDDADSGKAGKLSTAAAPANEPKRLVDDVGRTVGLNYIIIESFKSDARDDAETSLKFLAQNGISATMERSGSGWIIVSRDGYKFSDPKLDALTRRIIKLGEQYFKQGGRYKFQCYAKKYKGSW